MSNTHTPRIKAIRITLDEMVVHMNEFISAVRNMYTVLEGYEWSHVLLQVFTQLESSLVHLCDHTQEFSWEALGEWDEILRVYHVDKNLRKHIASAHEFILRIQKVYGTSSLDHATRFALIESEIVRIWKMSRVTQEIYATLMAHYADADGKITQHLENTKKYKQMTGIENQVWYLDLYSK